MASAKRGHGPPARNRRALKGRENRTRPLRAYPDPVNHASRLRESAATLPTLEHAFRWALAQQPSLRPVDVVIQDEYTHDILFGAPDGSFLVFDAT